MSAARRASLATVLRVAALQETVAKAAAGRATADALRAEQAVAAASAALASRGAQGVPLAVAAEARALGAAVVAAAQDDVAARAADRDGAVAAYTRARGRVRLFEELVARQRAEHEAELEKTAQRLADDLSAGRSRAEEGR